MLLHCINTEQMHRLNTWHDINRFKTTQKSKPGLWDLYFLLCLSAVEKLDINKLDTRWHLDTNVMMKWHAHRITISHKMSSENWHGTQLLFDWLKPNQVSWEQRKAKSSELGTEGEPNQVSWELKESQIKSAGNRRKAKSSEVGIEGKPNHVSWE